MQIRPAKSACLVNLLLHLPGTSLETLVLASLLLGQRILENLTVSSDSTPETFELSGLSCF